MMILKNPLIFPAFLLIWSIDIWFWLAFIRLILEKASPDNQITNFLSKLVDPFIKIHGRLMSKYLGKEFPQWSLWLITFFSFMTLRHILISSIVSN